MIGYLFYPSELQSAQAKGEGIVYKIIWRMSHASICNRVKKRLCQVFSPVITKIHVDTIIYSRLHSSNESL